MRYDVIVIGAGPAGLSAALVLARCRRTVLVCDSGKPRNAQSRALHGFLTRDGVTPTDLLSIARAQLHGYRSVTIRDVEVVGISAEADGFEVVFTTGTIVKCLKIVLATGVVDDIPRISGLKELYGRSVFHCPICDGWEVRDQTIGAYGRGDHGVTLALELRNWSRDVVLLTDGGSSIPQRDRDQLERSGVDVVEHEISALVESEGSLHHVTFRNGTDLPLKALFFSTGNYVRSPLAVLLGCGFTANGVIDTDENGETTVHAVYAAGDATAGTHLAIVAAAEGARVAVSINTRLSNEQSSRLRVIE